MSEQTVMCPECGQQTNRTGVLLEDGRRGKWYDCRKCGVSFSEEDGVYREVELHE